jgi:hypothetical protein
MKNLLAGAVTVGLACTLLADERSFARAFVRWERNPCLVSALHVATSGLFLAEDIAALG